MPLGRVYLDPSPGWEKGWSGPIVDSYGRPKGLTLREAKKQPLPLEEAPFDDTFKLSKARLREASEGGPGSGPRRRTEQAYSHEDHASAAKIHDQRAEEATERGDMFAANAHERAADAHETASSYSRNRKSDELNSRKAREFSRAAWNSDLGSEESREAASQNDGCFQCGVPTNAKTSSKNYSPNLVKMIDGEHKTLLNVGKINEAMENDIHDQHITEHRMLLASDDLSETQRNALLEHISSHVKARRQQQKIVENAQKGRYQKGLGFSSRAKPATTYDVIPQDDPQSNERKKTAGITSMEAMRANRFRRFRQAARRSSRRGL